MFFTRRAIAGVITKPQPRFPAPPLLFSYQLRYQGSKNYKPPGFKLAAQTLPISDEGIEKLQFLAKAAHREKNYADALICYERVTDYLRQKLETSIHEDLADNLYNIARIYIELKDYPAALEPAEEAAAIYEALHGTLHPKYIEAFALCALIYKYRRPNEAVKAFTDCLACMKTVYYNHKDQCWKPSEPMTLENPAKSPLSSVAHTMADFANLHVSNGDPALALDLLEQALEIRRYLYTDNTQYKPMIAQTLVKLAEVHRFLNKSTEAEQMADEAIAICMATAGRDAPATAQAISTKGHVLMSKNQANQAKKCFLESLTTFGLAYGTESSLVAHELTLFGRCCQMLREIKDAENAFQRAHTIYLANFGQEHVQVADALSHLGTLRFENGRYTEAERDISKALDIRRKLTPKDTTVPMLLHRLGEICASMKRTDAEAYFMESISLYMLLPEREHILATDVMDDMAWFYCNYSLHEKALEYFQKSLELRLKLVGRANPSIGYSYCNLASVHVSRKEYTNAETYCNMAMEVYKKLGNENFLGMADVYQTLGQIYNETKQYERTVQMYEKTMYVRRMNSQQNVEPFAQLLYATAKQMNEIELRIPDAIKYVDEAITIVNNTSKAENFLTTLYQLQAELKQKTFKKLETSPSTPLESNPSETKKDVS